jgi:hypothetical protein
MSQKKNIARWLAAPGDYVSAGLLTVLLGISLFTFRDYGLGWDDYAHAHYGKLLYLFYASGMTDVSAFSFSNLFFYGGGFDLAAEAMHRFTNIELYDARRLTGALVGIIGLVIVWRLTRRIGGPIAGLVAVTLLAITPAYYGHMFINAKDIPFAVAMIFLLYTLVRAFSEYPKPQPNTLVLFGIALGLTIGTRLIGGISAIFFVAGAAVVLHAEIMKFGFRKAAGRLAAFSGWLMLALPLAYLVMAFVWPWSVQNPLNPIRALAYYSNFWEAPWKELFDGVPIPIPDMPRYYVAKLCLLKLPELLVLFTVSGLIGGTFAIFNRKVDYRARAALALIAAAATVPIAFTIITKPVMYNGIRHFLFVLPPLAVLGGLAAAYVYNWISERSDTAMKLSMGAFILLVAISASQLIRIHPYQYALFNHFAGGLEGARNHYMLDYWGLGFKEASEELLQKLKQQRVAEPKGRKWKVAVCGPAQTVSYELGPKFEATNDPKGADFALSLGTFYCAKLDAPILAKAEREGIVFARAYDLRGKTVASTYTPETPSDRALAKKKVNTFWKHDLKNGAAPKPASLVAKENGEKMPSISKPK